MNKINTGLSLGVVGFFLFVGSFAVKDIGLVPGVSATLLIMLGMVFVGVMIAWAIDLALFVVGGR